MLENLKIQNEGFEKPSKDAWQHARDRVRELLALPAPPPLPEHIVTNLTERMQQAQSKSPVSSLKS